MKKRPYILISFMVFLFAFASVYSLFDALREADFLTREKYEQTDIDDVYAEKQSPPDAALVSPALFTRLPGIIFEFLSAFSFTETLLTESSSVLRC